MPAPSMDDAPATGQTFVRVPAHGNHTSVYYEVRELGVLVVRAESDGDDPKGTLYPLTMSLRSSALLARLAEDQTPLPPSADATPDQE